MLIRPCPKFLNLDPKIRDIKYQNCNQILRTIDSKIRFMRPKIYHYLGPKPTSSVEESGTEPTRMPKGPLSSDVVGAREYYR